MPIVLCECGKAASLVILDTEAAINAPKVICVDCCYKTVSQAEVGRYQVARIKER